ncbi:flagellar hook protein FlgK [Leclercia adecarboxylata]|nr:flagellar hook protein FlgK [Leclercia adecarboxylata]KMN61737.1 flagellar hook protein FlgK [Leclercia sp. LK8]
MNLLNLARSGLSSAQAALNVVGNNLNNAVIPGYCRQNIILGEAGGKTTGYGFFGYGVEVDGVQRAYDSFITNQVRGASTQFSALNSRYEELSQVDNMLGDDSSNISSSLDNIFAALDKVSSDPASSSARQEALAQFKAISNLYTTNSSTLNGLEKNTNTQISQAADDINSYAKQLANLNQEIEKIHGQTGDLPADLLDQRDSILGKLNDLVGIKVNENSETGRVDVTFANGLSLVNGDQCYQVKASISDADPNTTVVSYVDAGGNTIPLDETKMTTGKLGGLFKFRNEDLVDARNQLNQLALQMANKFNEVNHAGYDLDGKQGEDIFNIANPEAIANQNNTGDATLNVSFTDISAVNADDYDITFKGPGASDWEIKRSDGSVVTPTIGDNGEIQFDGVSFKPEGTPQPGDQFKLNPADGAADHISVALTDGDQIAASSSSDPTDQSNNENIKALIDIKNQAIVGKATLTEAYASLVSSVGSSMTALKADLATASNATGVLLEQQQSISGVDMNEEYMNLQMYTQYYQANAQVLQTATTIFDSLLNIR